MTAVAPLPRRRRPAARYVRLEVTTTEAEAMLEALDRITVMTAKGATRRAMDRAARRLVRVLRSHE